jgi:hypothetical protein
MAHIECKSNKKVKNQPHPENLEQTYTYIKIHGWIDNGDTERAPERRNPGKYPIPKFTNSQLRWKKKDFISHKKRICA